MGPNSTPPMPIYSDFVEELRGRLGSLMTVYTDSKLYAHFNFDGNTNNWTLNSRASYSGTAPTYVTGKYNSGGRLSSQVTVSLSHGDRATWSFNVWARFPATTSSGTIIVMSNIIPDSSDAGFFRSNSVVYANTPTNQTASPVFTISDTSSYTLFSLIKSGNNATYYVGTTSSYTTSFTHSNGSAIYMGNIGAATDYDKLLSWDTALSADEVNWINQGFRVYIDEETENGIDLPGIGIYTNPDQPARYWLSTNEEVLNQFAIDLGFKYAEHKRTIDGSSLSTYNLTWYYVDTLNKMLNAVDFTTSNLDETERRVEVIRQVDRFDHGYLGGCTARVTFARRVDWSA